MNSNQTPLAEQEKSFLNFCTRSLSAIANGNYRNLDLEDHNFNAPEEFRVISVLKQLQERFKLLDAELEKIEIGRFDISPLLEKESDLLSTRIKGVMQSYNTLVLQIEDIVQGDFSRAKYSRDSNDQLGLMLEKIVANFQYVDWRIGMIAEGDCSAKIPPLSEKDELGKALDKLTRSMHELTEVAERVSNGDLTQRVQVKGKRDMLGSSINSMVEGLENLEKKNQHQQWFKNTLNELFEKFRGNRHLDEILDNTLKFYAKKIGFKVGCFYLFDEQKQVLELKASYAFKRRKADSCQIALGDSLIGQIAMEQEAVIFNNLPEDYLNISSSLGEMQSQSVLLAPVRLNGELKGVFELGDFVEIEETKLDFINETLEGLAIAINSAQVTDHMEMLLEQTELQRKELEKQKNKLQKNQEALKENQLELQESNEELKVKSELAEQAVEELRVKSEQAEDANTKLRAQSEELHRLNAELNDKHHVLEEKQQQLEARNDELEKTKETLEQKAEQLAESSRYKSEFLANMSHELRTPLNSLMILAKMLADNDEGNLNQDQVESADIILNSGRDLMTLINEILDLSKVEAGKMDVNSEPVDLSELIEGINGQFIPMAIDKGLDFKCEVSSDLPARIISDGQRLKQVLRNLISNAIKFTHRGSVKLYVRKFVNKESCEAVDLIKFEIHDTGIGIPEDKLSSIFEAFQQVDGSTSREYGGTGLGLTISRELSQLLGAELTVKSEVDHGSQFILQMPIKETADSDSKQDIEEQAGDDKSKIVEFTSHGKKQSIDYVKEQNQSSVEDDREQLQNDDNILLIIEDDLTFTKTLIDLARRKNYKCLSASDGQTGIELARKWQPQGILLDLDLPDIEGEKVLHFLKENSVTRHIPVHIVSARDDHVEFSGAIGHTVKPPTENDINSALNKIEKINQSKIKKLLLVEDDDKNRKAICTMIQDKTLEVVAVSDGNQAYDRLASEHFDCVVMDLTLPDIDGLELLERLDEKEDYEIPPVIIYTGRNLSKKEHQDLSQYTNSIVIKGNNSPERLLDEIAMFLHRVEDDQSENQKNIVHNLHNPQAILSDKSVLLVDDDMRNTFAMTKVLKANGLQVQIAENGKIALDKINSKEHFDIVLMDIMMPVMDGYQAMQNIRRLEQYKELPIIALTAKAMPEDRKKCLDAGANDYITKPIDTAVMLSMMQVWLTQKRNVSSIG